MSLYIGRFNEKDAEHSTKTRGFGYKKELMRHQTKLSEMLANSASEQEITMMVNYVIFYLIKLGQKDQVRKFLKLSGF